MYNWEPVNPNDLMEFPIPAPSLLGHHMVFFFFSSVVSFVFKAALVLINLNFYLCYC